MSATDVTSTKRIRDRLAGQHLLVTGSTGFLAKVFVEKLLRAVDTVGGIHLLVRSRSDGTSAAHRVKQEVLRSSVFDRLRAALGDRFARLCDEKIQVVDGDLTLERFGLSESAYAELSRRITMVVNSAATVTFDERLDQAVELNSLGPTRLLRFARDCGDIPFLHVSTCYVCGARSGVIVEDFSAPESARESLPRVAKGGAYDLDRIVEELRLSARSVLEKHGAETETARRELIEAGMSAARSHGWNDTYTFTKWIGEQLLVRDHDRVPLVVFRPAIIEGSFEEPAPGWIDGLRMADPIIVAYGRGKLAEFPARSDIPIDLIPVDYVANAMIATLPSRENGGESVRVFQCASSERNPLLLEGLRTALERAFEHRPMNGDDGRPIPPKRLRFVDRESFIRRWEGRLRTVTRLQAWMRRFGQEGRRFRKLTAKSRQIEQVIYFAKIYSPYTHLDCRFADDGLKSVAERLHPDDRAEFPFDPVKIDWDDYLIHRHVPGLRAYVLGTAGEPSPRIVGLRAGLDDSAMARAAASPATDVFEAFRRSAAVFGDKPALQIRRDGRWIRYTYDEVLRATGTIAKRFTERGLKPGDRVALSAENGPEWGLAYLAIMRCGMTGVPLDPQLPPGEAWNAARFAGAKLLCAGRGTHESLRKGRLPTDVEVVTLADGFIPPPAASRDPAPDPVRVDPDAIASILFTSGTTLTPKAVPLTHRNLLTNASALLSVHRIGPCDELLSVLPLYHVFEFTGGFLVPLSAGATVTYVEPLKGAEITAAMQATGTTIMLVVPRLLKMFHDSIENAVAASGALKRTMFGAMSSLADWSGNGIRRSLFAAIHKNFGGHLRMFVCGGSRLDPDLFHSFARLGFEVYEGYGLTETSPVLTLNPPGSPRAGSVGPALPNIELDLRNTNLEGIGEVWARGPSVMSGYLDNPIATRASIVDGWFRTGDLGKRDGDGFLFLTGRSSDLIVTGAGKNVYPDDVETRYAELPYAKEMCVFGVPSADGMGDAVHAVVVIDEGARSDLDRSSIEREVRLAAERIGEALPTHQRIGTLHFWDRELPKTSTLKAKRSLIRDMVCGENAGAKRDNVVESKDSRSVAGSSDATLAAVQRILSKQTKRSADVIHPTMHLLLDLGIDSIGKIDLIGSIEGQFGIRIDDAAAAKISRVSDVIHAIGDRPPTTGGGRGGDVWRRLVGGSNGANASNGHASPVSVPVRWLARGTVNLFMNSYVRVDVRGSELIPAKGGFILAPNHASHLDAPSVLTAVGGKRRVWVAGAEDYFFNTGLKRFVFGTLFDTIPFDRQSDGVAGLRRCGEALTRGDGLLMFPEGTRSIDGTLQSFKVGIAVLAVEHRVPIVPVRIDHAYDLFPKGSRVVRPGTVRVAFGEPIVPPDKSSEGDHYAMFARLARQVQDCVVQLGYGVVA